MNTIRKILLLGLAGLVAGLSGCAMSRGLAEGTMAMLMETPSMELVLDRLNTAGTAAKIAHVAFNNAAISADATWPAELEDFSKDRMTPVVRALALDGAYAAHGGIVSPIKVHVVMTQDVLYTLPPDMYSSEGTCYRPGEETILNGIYYKVNSPFDIVRKDTPTMKEIQSAVADGAKSIFTNAPCNDVNQVIKRNGKLRPQAGTHVYRNIMTAIQKILPNGKAIRDAYKDYDSAKRDMISKSAEIAEANADVLRFEKNEKPLFFKTKADAEEAVKVRKADLAQLELNVDEKEAILDATLDTISDHKGEVTDPRELKTLQNVVQACEAVENLLIDAGFLATIAVAKLPQSVQNLPNEIKALGSPRGLQNVYLPLRLARLRFNIGNSVDNIQLIIDAVRKDASVVMKINSEISKLIDLEIAPSPEAEPAS
ncbi:MAG: hypothetical protein ACNI3A_19060 [Desulfovibrio sp.]|uniref:hypothetical protein n=1 Tax=Desulfovibrio sp. 7SRBS1 TaxID=3378064 RepID=UPI003B417400